MRRVLYAEGGRLRSFVKICFNDHAIR